MVPRVLQKYHILLGGRVLEKAKRASEEALGNSSSQSSVEPFLVDVESDESIMKAYEDIADRHPRIDCLVNNAGACFDACIQNGTMTTRSAWNKSWDVNVTGAQIMTSTFLPLLLKSTNPRLIFVTSGLSSLEGASDPSNPGNAVPPSGLPKVQAFARYRACKTGLNMMMLNWARALKSDGFKVWSVAPGLFATSLGGDTEVLRKLGAKDPSIGGKVLRGVIEGRRDADVGKVVRVYKTPVQPW
ncbi:short chain dehydrogenase [Lizonia empirigonia]|nr:short chain dehydrogenase [Lizonia empirigonia]